MTGQTDPFSGVPHRPPFVFVDRALEVTPGKRAVAIKNVTVDEALLLGHFPDHPLLPGVLLIEAMAQTAGIALHAGKKPGEKSLLAGVRQVKFKQQVKPGEQVVITAEIMSQLGPVVQFQCSATVGGILVAEGEIVLSQPS